MKKFASITLVAAMVLTLAGCGQQDTASSDNSSVIAPSEPDVTSTSATTTSATTTAATTTTTEATTTTAPVVEEEPAQADPTAITGDVTLNAASSIAKGTLVGAYGDVVILYNEVDRTYYLADINGEPINDTVYSYVDRGFDENGYALLQTTDYVNCVIDKQGNTVYEDTLDYSDGILVTSEVSGTYYSEIFFSDENMYKFTFADSATGNVLCTLDEHEIFPEPDEYTPYFRYQPYSGNHAVLYAMFSVGVHGFAYLYSVDKQGNMSEIYARDSSCILEEEFTDNILDNAIINNDALLLTASNADEPFSIVYNMNTNEYLKLDGVYSSLKYANCENDIYALGRDDTYNIVSIDASDMTILLDGLTTAVDSGCDKYLLISDGEKWGYYVIDSGEVVWYDDATNFHNGYAFVIEDGKGHFVNEAFEAVTDDIAATGAKHYDGLLYLADTEQFYPVNYPVAE